jgi:tetratricopeptide (TPR) repeat protein
MKLHFLYLLLICNSLFAQTSLTFNKSEIECEDKWIVYHYKDSIYSFGFIYIDQQAGPTLQAGGSFKIAPNGSYTLIDTASAKTYNIKARLIPSSRKVALIPENKLPELLVAATPDWLKVYKSDTSSVNHFYRWGYIYNEWDRSDLALPYLERAQQIDANNSDVLAELSYTYNALGKFEKAVTLLKNSSNKNCYQYKEFTYALIRLGQLQEADNACKEALQQCNDKSMKVEIAFNMAGAYYRQKDKANYAIWSAETKKYTEPNDRWDVQNKKIDKLAEEMK